MSYQLFDPNGVLVEEADCLYDFNEYLGTPFPMPADGDWHSLDDKIQEAFEAENFSIGEV